MFVDFGNSRKHVLYDFLLVINSDLGFIGVLFLKCGD